jgi:hypothetical protein
MCNTSISKQYPGGMWRISALARAHWKREGLMRTAASGLASAAFGLWAAPPTPRKGWAERPTRARVRGSRVVARELLA